MRKFIIEDHSLIVPFNEPARDLSILNKPLKIHHADILDEVLGPTEAELPLSTVHDLPHLAPGRDECVVFRDNLYFDLEFFGTFFEQARASQLPSRAVLPASDAAWMKYAIPLSRQAIEIIRSIQHDAGYSRFLFPSLRSANRPMSENTINAALRRMGFAQTEMTGHGFRAMAATLLNEMGIWHADAIERQLAHCDGNAVRRAYARGEYWEERVRMMQHWSDYLDTLRRTSPTLTGVRHLRLAV